MAGGRIRATPVLPTGKGRLKVDNPLVVDVWTQHADDGSSVPAPATRRRSTTGTRVGRL